MICKLYPNQQRADFSKLATYLRSIGYILLTQRSLAAAYRSWTQYCKSDSTQWHSNIKLLSQMSILQAEIDLVGTCPSAQKEADDEKTWAISARFVAQFTGTQSLNLTTLWSPELGSCFVFYTPAAASNNKLHFSGLWQGPQIVIWTFISR